MLTREARLQRLTRIVNGDGSISHTALISFDESAATTVRLTEEEHAILEAAMTGKRRVVMTLRIGAPGIRELAQCEAESAA